LKGGDPRAILSGLMEKRNPIYAEADLAVDSLDQPTDITVTAVLRSLAAFVRSAEKQEA